MVAAVIVAAWQNPTVDAQRRQWVRDYHDTIPPHSDPGRFPGFMAEDDQDKVQTNYADNYARLAEIKRIYDPGNLFRLNQNIKP